MDIWQLFGQLSDNVKIVIVLAVFIILLVIAFSPSAGENITSVLLIVGTLVGTTRISRTRRSSTIPQKKESFPYTKQKSSQDSQREHKKNGD
jgi:ABC-type dipeptide/oligopeptide/nickel transport system permease subunit